MSPARLNPQGTVWSWTVSRVGPDGPTTFVYVDLDDGPRVLARLTAGTGPAVGDRVWLTGHTATGDLQAAHLEAGAGR